MDSVLTNAIRLVLTLMRQDPTAAPFVPLLEAALLRGTMPVAADAKALLAALNHE
jgi:hypothetical protein